MKRLSLFSCFCFLVSCGGSAASQPPAQEALSPEPAPVEIDEPLAEDPYADVLPTGAFPTIEALCNEQMKLSKPRIEDMRNTDMRVEADDGTPLAPSCGISDALKDTRVSVNLPIRVLTAIDVETGESTQTFLVALTEEGWKAVRQPFLTAFHDDPGCPSIERENAIVSVEAKQGVLVVVTTSDKGGYADDGPTEVAMTKARVCKLAGDCTSAVVVESIASRWDTDQQKNVTTQTFETAWTLDANNEIAVATAYESE